jgi:hypothetical protein
MLIKVSTNSFDAEASGYGRKLVRNRTGDSLPKRADPYSSEREALIVAAFAGKFQDRHNTATTTTANSRDHCE